MNPISSDARIAINVPRIVLSRAEAAEALGMSLTSFEQYVQPEIKLIRRGRLGLVTVAELTAWAERAAEPTLSDRRAA